MADDPTIHDPADESTAAGATDQGPSHGGDGAERDRPLVATGSSHVGEPGYDGDVQVSAEGADARPESFRDSFGRPGSDALDPSSVPEETRRAWERAEDD